MDFRPWTKEGIHSQSKEAIIDEELSDNAASVDSQEAAKTEVVDKWLYQLVGVLIHSGGADAGHYYSYIKDTNPGPN